MAEPQLTREAKEAIRTYIITLMAIPGVAISIIMFLLGLFLNDVVKQGAYNEAFKTASSELFTAYQKVAESTEAARQAAVEAVRLKEDLTRAEKEAKDIRASLKTAQAFQQSEQIVDQVVDSLVKRNDFTEKIQKKYTDRLEEVENKLNTTSTFLPINCTPSGNSGFDVSNTSFDKDIFTCTVDTPSDGFLYLSLQGHQRSRDGTPCSFGIFANGKSINTASRDLPSHTYVSSWHPTFMADTVTVQKGQILLSVRVSGKECSIHDPDINGIFIPHLK